MTAERIDGTALSRSQRLRSPSYLHHRALHRELSRRRGLLRGVVVDVGCGAQPYRAMLTPAVERYIGADVAWPGSRAEVTIADERIELPDCVADAALCTQVLEHSRRPEALLGDIARVLKPNGTLLVTVPLYWPHHEEPHDYLRFTRHGLAGLLEDAGFGIDEMVPCGGRWSVAGLAAIHATDSRLVRLAANVGCGLLDRRARGAPDWQTSTILAVGTRPP
ncbi:MAG: class I SAM-dependent methyltransferase [Actinobacteria bacterium]|nr:class I SAM-dependent methyltransferase [Actinomycetota bacterium]